MFENPRRGRQARSFTTNVSKIQDLKSSSEQIFSEICRWVPLKVAVEQEHLRVWLPSIRRHRLYTMLCTRAPLWSLVLALKNCQETDRRQPELNLDKTWEGLRVVEWKPSSKCCSSWGLKFALSKTGNKEMGLLHICSPHLILWYTHTHKKTENTNNHIQSCT